VVLYDQVAYRGTAATLQVGSYSKKDLIKSGASINGVASITVPAGCKLEIFSSDNHQGPKTTLLPGEYSKTGMAATNTLLLEDTNEAMLLDPEQLKAAAGVQALGSVRVLDLLLPRYVQLSSNSQIPSGQQRMRLSNDEWEQDEHGYFTHAKTGKHLGVSGGRIDMLTRGIRQSLKLGSKEEKIPLCTNHQCPGVGQLEGVLCTGTKEHRRFPAVREV
jgi:hypothetical protein